MALRTKRRGWGAAEDSSAKQFFRKHIPAFTRAKNEAYKSLVQKGTKYGGKLLPYLPESVKAPYKRKAQQQAAAQKEKLKASLRKQLSEGKNTVRSLTGKENPNRGLTCWKMGLSSQFSSLIWLVV